MARAVLVIATIAMLLISIHPFALRKLFLLVIALLSLSSAVCFADPLFMTSRYTPANAEVHLARMPITLMPQTNQNPLPPNGTSGDRGIMPFQDKRPTPFLILFEGIQGDSLVSAGMATSPLPTIRTCWLSPFANLATDNDAAGASAGNF